jgi:hypothetical protein
MATPLSDELFESPQPLLGWLPGESFFSCVSRQHAFWGNRNSDETANILFGQRHAGTHHDFPSALDAFALRTGGLLGQAEELALSRTLLSFYRPFSSVSQINDCLLMMRSQSVVHLKFRLGLLTSRFRANHPLKACPTCMALDLASTGWSYWHLEHQYPGVWLCALHKEPLHEATIKSTGVGRFSWCLPDGANLKRDWSPSANGFPALSALSDMTLQLVRQERSYGWLGGTHVVPVMREQINQKGWLTPSGNLRMTELTPSYFNWCHELRGPAELQSLPASEPEAAAQIARLLSPWRTGTHPIRVLVALSWLFKDANSFLSTYDKVHASNIPLKPPDDLHSDTVPMDVSDREICKSSLVAFIKNGMSATAAAKETGVDVGTAMAWAAQAGIQIPRRPKTLTTAIQTALRRDLIQGAEKVVAASTQSLSVQAVTRFLRTEPGLYQTWQDARARNALIRARTAWSSAAATHGHLGVKLLRAMDPAIYAWLYRNDQAWLQDHLPPPVTRSKMPLRVKWDARDLELSAAVEQTLEKLRVTQQGKPVKLWQIYQAMPQLKPKLPALEKLPLTQRAIDRGLKRISPKTQDDMF